jgi:hypothetical protein
MPIDPISAYKFVLDWAENRLRDRARVVGRVKLLPSIHGNVPVRLNGVIDRWAARSLERKGASTIDEGVCWIQVDLTPPGIPLAIQMRTLNTRAGF